MEICLTTRRSSPKKDNPTLSRAAYTSVRNMGIKRRKPQKDSTNSMERLKVSFALFCSILAAGLLHWWWNRSFDLEDASLVDELMRDASDLHAIGSFSDTTHDVLGPALMRVRNSRKRSDAVDYVMTWLALQMDSLVLVSTVSIFVFVTRLERERAYKLAVSIVGFLLINIAINSLARLPLPWFSFALRIDDGPRPSASYKGLFSEVLRDHRMLTSVSAMLPIVANSIVSKGLKNKAQKVVLYMPTALIFFFSLLVREYYGFTLLLSIGALKLCVLVTKCIAFLFQFMLRHFG